MSEYCAISTRNFSRKEVDKFGKVTILRKGIGLEIELKLDIDDPVEKKLYLVDEVIKQLNNIVDDKSLIETIKNKVGVEKMQTLAELVDGKYDEEVTIAVLVSKFK